MKMHRNVLFAVAGMALLFAVACNDSPFTAENESAAIPVITGQPQGATYNVGALAAALTVTASVSDGGTLSYQWYSNASDSNKNGTIVSGKTEARYTPSTANEGVVYYYVMVTNTLNGKTAGVSSNTAKIEVNNKGNAEIPNITVQPRSATYNAGATAAALTVTASVSDEGTLSYQWYRNTNNSNEGGTVIPDATEASYTPLTTTAGTVYYYAVVTNTISGDGSNKTTAIASAAAEIKVNAVYTIVIDISDNVDGDTVTASPDTGKAGDTVTLTYTVANTAHYNLLEFGGVTDAIADVDGAGDGTRTYVINADDADASSGVITITVIFTHTNLVPDHITFTETGHINKTYGDTAFTNAVVTGYSGSGAITYSSSDTTVATVNSAGQVTILKAGSTIITAEKAADTVYAHAQEEYTLAVNPKPVTITGLSAVNKVYDGTTTATASGTAVVSGLVGGDTVTVSAGTAAFINKTVANNKAVTFSGYSLTGADAGNYSLSAQPASVTANITVKSVTITGLSVANKQYDGTTTATVTGTATISDKISTDTVTVSAGTAAFANKTVANNKAVTFSGYSLTGADAGNYSLSAQPASVTANITAKSVTITGLSAANKQYDGTTTATVTGTATISGKISTDTVTVSAGTAAFANATVGNNKTVNFSGYSLSGTDAGNYSLTQPTATANIEYVSMVQISAGTFTMGSPTGESGRESNETQHSVTLSSFYMGTYQVTQVLYQLVMGTNPSNFTTAVAGESGTPGRLPVEMVTWYDAVEFCNKLSALDGKTAVYTITGRTPASGYPITGATVTMDSSKNGYRLPTEAQWEYACRAGTTTAYNTGTAISDNTGWYGSNSESKTHQVGLKPANAWGLYDMHGNVWEWCWDRYGTYVSGAQTNPTGVSSGSDRVVRGGSWVNSAGKLRSAYRDYNDPSSRGNRLYSFGFRLARQ